MNEKQLVGPWMCQEMASSLIHPKRALTIQKTIICLLLCCHTLKLPSATRKIIGYVLEDTPESVKHNLQVLLPIYMALEITNDCRFSWNA